MKTSVMAQLLVSAGPSLFPGLADRFSDWRRSAPPALQPPSGSPERIGSSGSAPLSAARRRIVSAHRTEPARRAHSAQSDNGNGVRSEEHTSELQSLMRISYDVFCLTKKITLSYPRKLNQTR